MNKSIHQRCAFGIINCIRTLWQEQDLQDFNFEVEDTLFHCHRALLGACSPVFRGMFKSGMKEDKEGLAKLKEISKETFQQILKVLYTGRDVLTVDNFINIWKAAHMLQIDFLVKHCEKCAIKFIKIENFHKFNEIAQLFGSKTVLKVSRKFILKNFNAVRKTKGFSKLSSNEVLSIVKRQDLVVSSEDIVLEAIIDWADYYKDEPATKQNLDVNGTKCERGSGDHEKADNVKSIGTVNTEGSDVNHQKEKRRNKKIQEDYKENDIVTRSQSHVVHRKSRQKSLASLLKASRLCLASSLFLKTLYKHELVQSNYEARNIIFTAVMYQVSTCWHGQWPSTAIHRACSDFDNFGVYVSDETNIEAFSFGKGEWGTLKRCSSVDTIFRLDSYNNELYAFGQISNRMSNNFFICRFDGNEWRTPIPVPSQDTEAILVAHGDFMYILSNQAKRLYRFNPTDVSINVQVFTPLPPDTTFECAFSIEMNILAFCDALVNYIFNDKHETLAYSLNIADKKWTRCGRFEGPAEHMISFRDDNDYYILQTDGSLHVVTVGINGVVGFKFLAKLWDFNKVLHGAVIYKNCLNILGNDPSSDPEDKDKAYFLAGRFKDITYWDDDDATSNFVPATLRKTHFCSHELQFQ